ncbi:MAG: WD40/YVTN/BNR-like repeat-containing protein, partial [Chitinophagales bacterium]
MYSHKLAEINGYAEWELAKTADPSSGSIPAYALMAAYKELAERGYYKNAVAGGVRFSAGWQPVNDFFNTLSITKIVYDPFNTHTFYFSTGEGWFNADAVRGAGIWKSEDGGLNWYQIPSTAISIFDYCQDIDIHPLTGDIYVATRSGGLQRSVDGGNTWQKVLGTGAGSTRNSICDVEITADGGVFVGIGIFETDGIYYSPSGDSATFVKQTVGLPSSGYYRIELAVAQSDPDIAYAIPCSVDYRIQGVYRTDDRGATWQATELPGGDRELAGRQAWYDLIIEVDPNNANTVIAGGLHLWKSTDGGGTWKQLSSGGLDSVLLRYVHVDQHAILFHTSDEVYFGNDGGIYKTDNLSASKPFIYERNTGYNVTQFYSADLNPVAGSIQLIGGTQDNGSCMAVNPGVSFIKPLSGADGAFTAFNTLNEKTFYTATQYRRFFRFTNGGYELPDTLTIDTLTDNNVQFINPWAIDPVNPENIFYASNLGLWRIDSASTATRNDWEKACTLGGSITAVAVSENPEGIVFIGRNSNDGQIFALYDAATVDPTSAPLGLDPADMLPDAGFGFSIYCSSIVVDPNDANHLLVTYSNYGVNSVWETNNALSGAPVWNSVEGDLPNIPVRWAAIHPANPNVAYLATEMGVFFTNQLNGSSTQWIPCTNFPIVRTDMLRVRANDFTIVAATHGRGLWTSQLDPAGANNDIVWSERGPNNIGGRTRALMVDPNDPTGNTIWAGSASGGLWKTTDINATDITPANPQEQNFTLFPNPVSGNTAMVDLHRFAGEKISLSLFTAKGQLLLRPLIDFKVPNGLI